MSLAFSIFFFVKISLSNKNSLFFRSTFFTLRFESVKVMRQFWPIRTIHHYENKKKTPMDDTRF